MKLTCVKEELVKGLDKVDNAIPTKTTVPILANVLLQTAPDELRLVATDLQVAISCVVKANIEEQGSITLPAKTFSEFIRSLAAGALVKVNVTAGKAVISSGKSRCTLAGLSSQDFPTVEEFNEQASFSVLVAPFLSVLRKTAFSASTDETRYILNGVHLSIVGKEIKAAATDGRRLAVSSQTLESESPDLAAIVPSKAVAEVLRIMGDSDKDQKVQVAITPTSIAFKRDGLLLVSRLIEGNFPDYESVIPKENKIVVAPTKTDLAALIQRATIGSDRTAVVTLFLEQNLLQIKSSNSGRVEIEDEMPIDFGGSPFSTNFNGSYFLEALKAISSEKVSLRFVSTESPFVIESTGDDSALYVIMPMRL